MPPRNPNKPPNGVPNANEWGKLRSRLARAGMSQQQIKEAIGQNVGGRSRAEITAMLIAWLEGR